MTPTEIANQIAQDTTWDNTEGLLGMPIDYRRLDELIAEAIIAERAVADEWREKWEYLSQQLHDEIQKRWAIEEAIAELSEERAHLVFTADSLKRNEKRFWQVLENVCAFAPKP